MYSFGNHKYDGAIKNGVPHGRGKMYWADKSVYDGDWWGGKMHGSGIMTSPDGTRRHGRWINGEMNGQGEIHYPDGRVYSGSIVAGQCHGYGRLQHPGGEWFEGEFAYDRITENGSYNTANGQKRTVSQQRAATRPGFMKALWLRTWRLWAALACFAIAILVGIWLMDFFSGNGPSRIRVKGVILPLLLAYAGFKCLISFFSHLSDSLTNE